MLVHAVNVRRWLREDRHTPYAERLQRDRRIGRELAARDDLGRVLGWWQRVHAAEQDPSLGHRVEAGRRLACVALTVLGVLLGVAVAGIALGYEGRYPVNLFALLGVLVGLPLLMMLITLLLLPGRIPGLAAVQSVAAGMNPGRWVGAWLDRFLGAELFAPGLLRGGASAFSRWQLAVFSQWLALGFFAGALAVALLLVTFTDLAFGWSTTLNLDPALVYAWVSALSAPWAGWLPQAAPDLALVEASRYVRLDQSPMAQGRVEQLGNWWPFVLMTIVVYGVLPRLLLLLFAAWRLRRATRRLLLEDPEVTALLDRLEEPLVELGGNGEETPGDHDRPGLSGPREALAAEGLLLVIWNQAAAPETARAWLRRVLGVDAAAAVEAGILQDDAQQRGVLAAGSREMQGAVRRLVVVTKGWEPPLLEFMDYLGLLREEFGTEPSITIVPLDVRGTAVRAAQRDVWAKALARVRDPRLYVMDAQAEAAP
ncbi:MAG: DUF2868 domain-containing protein [Gammaproteobacteria bacterium]|nr:DUF2868 domain-containing protein [Gammaproteobacteria bacterium]